MSTPVCTYATIAVSVLMLAAPGHASFVVLDEDFTCGSDPLSYLYQDPAVSTDSYSWSDAADNMAGEARRGKNAQTLDDGTAERASVSFSAAGYGDADQYVEYTEDFDFSFDVCFSSFVPAANDERLMLGLWYSAADGDADNPTHFETWANRQHFVGATIEESGGAVRFHIFFGNGGDWSGKAVSDDLTGGGSLVAGVNYRIEGHYRWDGSTYGQVFGTLTDLDAGTVVGAIVQETVTQDTPDVYSVAYANMTADMANRRFLMLSTMGVGNETWGVTRNAGAQFTSDNWRLELYDPVVLTSLQVKPSSNAVYVGGTAPLFCEGYDGTGTCYDVTTWVEWSSLDPATALINEVERTCTGIAQGGTHIRAALGALESPLAAFEVLPPRTPHATAYGLDVLLQWRDLATLKPGCEAGMASSYNRNVSPLNTTGDNNWYDSHSYRLTGNVDPTTIRERTGRPGLITRTWMPWMPGPEFKLKFYFDGEPTPRLDTTTLAWYDAGIPGHAAIEEPFVGKGTGGAWCYAPLYFQDGLTIESDNRVGQLNFYQMNYLLLPPGTEVETYTATQSASQRADWNLAAEVLNAVGTNPGPAGANVIQSSGSLGPGETLVLADLGTGQQGIITRLQIKLDAPTDVQLAGAKLKVSHPNLAEPAIDVPIGEFFGAGRDRVISKALSLGTDHDDGYYCYLPMPFRSGVRVEIVNDSAETVDVTSAHVEYEPQAVDATYATLHARRRQETFAPGVDTMYEVLSVPDGSGHYLGCLMTITRSPEEDKYGYLEGNDIIEVDGGAKETLYGTGLEDAFNGGYYYKNAFDGPFSGLLAKLANGMTSQYRHRITDFVPFEQSILVEYQAVDCWGQEYERTYESTAYWYEQPPAVPGDVDGNGIVNGLDLAAVITAWETTPGDPLWNPAADLDGSGVVDGFDLTEIIANWTPEAAAAPPPASASSGAEVKPGRSGAAPGNVKNGTGNVRRK